MTQSDFLQLFRLYLTCIVCLSTSQFVLIDVEYQLTY